MADPAADSAVRAEQIRTVYRQSVWVFLANPINALILSLVLWRLSPHRLLLWWMAAMSGITALRLFLRWRYQTVSPAAADWKMWAVRFGAGTALMGLGWGTGAALLFDAREPAGQLFISFVVGGMVAGASGTLAFYVPAFVWFAVGALLPLSLRFAYEGDAVRLGMAGLVIVYGVTLTFVAINTQRSLTKAVRLRFANEQLLVRLSGTQTSLEEINHTLEQRVAERSAELERQGQALRDAQRMESVGLLAGGVAHDFNNLLTVVMANVHLLSGDASLSAPARLSVGEIQGAASRAASLVSQLLAFGRRQTLLPKVFDLNSVVREMEGLLGRLIGDNVQLAVAFSPQRLLVKADPGQMEQVIINLATNARDAMPNGGRLTIETDAEQVGGGVDGAAPVGVPAGSYVVLTVHDSGVGMDSETRRQAFDPFFTTKEVGKGTGLGLATVYGIVEQSGGNIIVDSQPGQGSRFRIFLPRLTADDEALATPPPVPAVDVAAVASAANAANAPKRARILVAEDHPLLRKALSRVLSGLGHDLLIAEDGVQALAMSRAHEGEIDLLVTDVVMARMGGLELARSLASERPKLRVLFISGYSWDKALPPIDPKHGVDFLRKPFVPGELADKVTRLLSAVRTEAMADSSAPVPAGVIPVESGDT